MQKDTTKDTALARGTSPSGPMALVHNQHSELTPGYKWDSHLALTHDPLVGAIPGLDGALLLSKAQPQVFNTYRLTQSAWTWGLQSEPRL